MTLLAAVLIAQSPYLVKPDQFLTVLRSTVGSGVTARVEELFQRKEDAAYLFEMAARQGGLRGIKVAVIPAPPGWEDTAPFWAVFHTSQEIEQDHDPVYPMLRTNNGIKLGKELPEWAGHETRISNILADARLYPRDNKINVKTTVELDGKKTTRAVIFRLNDDYDLVDADAGNQHMEVVDGNGEIPKPKEGDVVRAGGLLIPWTAKAPKRMTFSYGAVLKKEEGDKVNDRVAYVTAWWTPSIGRLPHTSTVRVTGPKAWVLKSEGGQIDSQQDGMGPVPNGGADMQTLSFRCNVPISFPKVVGGLYTLAAEGTANGKQLRSYKLEPVDKGQAAQDVQKMAEAIQFYEKNLGPFPFDHYWCFDSVGFYGIESYSHTLLQKGNTLRFVAHEMGHTYFGGLVPSTYIHDTWNEGMTQYIDSIVFQNNSDQTLQAGLRGVNLNLPLTQMNIAWANGSASYWRGAYVMKMLEAEIGQDKVLEALRAIIKDRVGKDTAWPDLLPYFEMASGQKLGWYWKQWVSNAQFPTLKVLDTRPVQIEKKWRTQVTVKQSGTPEPFRLKFLLRVRRGGQTAQQLVTLTAPQGSFMIDSPFQPTSTEIDVLPYALARAE